MELGIFSSTMSPRWWHDPVVPALIDEIFTPSHLANDLVELATAGGRELGVVADFAAGDGALLHAAVRKQPSLEVVGLDISRTTVRKLQAKNSSWQVGACDFLNPRSRASSPVLRRNRGRVSTALLNPPFSCRGAHREQVSLGGKRLTCSVAMAFILTAVDYLTPNGLIIAVAPRGIEKSERDEAAWVLLGSMGTVEIVGYPDRGAFPGTALRSLLLRFTMGPSTVRRRDSRSPVATQDKRPLVSLVRGTVQMHRARLTSAGMPLVHTTDLSNGQLRPERGKTSVPGRSCRGPVVLIPRVGRPMLSKVVLLTLRSDMTLSDCVIALECSSEDDSVKVRRVIEARWDEFEDSYGGSCAPYVTLKALQDVLNRFGFQSEVRRESRRLDGFASTSPTTVRRSPILLERLQEAPHPLVFHQLADKDQRAASVSNDSGAAPGSGHRDVEEPPLRGLR